MTQPSPERTAIGAYAGFCLLEGTGADFESFARARPEMEAELRVLHDSWSRALGALRALSEDSRAAASVCAELGFRPAAPDERSRGVLANLAHLRATGDRYVVEGLVGEGGMGTVLRVHDRALGRPLAMKKPKSREDGAGLDGRALRRFLDEAELLGKLDHPGIVAVHDLAVDEGGVPYFTMPMLEGLRLRDVFDRTQRGARGSDPERVLEVLLKVCDALAYAHERGVVHRDLKPDHVLIGRFGEVYVMDWGLSRARGKADRVDDPPASGAPILVRRGGEDDLATLSGEVLGTPGYMAPEQAEGRGDLVGPAADVYALGTILYEWLAGHRPYAPRGSRPTGADTLRALLAGPPQDVESAAPDAPPELAAICRKAMSRRIEDRYPRIADLGADLRAYSEGRVVAAHEHGAWPELRKWCRRNRYLAAALLAAIVVGAAGLALTLRAERARRDTAEVAAAANAVDALPARAEQLWPATPDNAPAMERWLEEARAIVALGAAHAEGLGELRRRALPYAPDSSEERAAAERSAARCAELDAEIRGQEAEILDIETYASGPGREEGIELARWRIERAAVRLAKVRAEGEGRQVWRFTSPDDQRLHDQLARIVTGAADFVHPVDGAIPAMEQRLALARDVGERSLVEHAGTWRAAIASIADERSCPAYRGLRIAPQVGLVPIGRDPRSGLWEFVHLASGDVPGRSVRGVLELAAEHGIVLVLVPPGRIEMGHDSNAIWDGAPLPTVELDAFLLGKHEVTQAQWWRMTGANPSYFRVGTHWADRTCDAEGNKESRTITWKHPVDQVSWVDARTILGRFALGLPTEAQWEYACRAGTTTPWCLGATTGELRGRVNVGDGVEGGMPYDGYLVSAPVDTFPSNPWGFLHILGNVSEWVADPFWTRPAFAYRAGDGLQDAPRSSLQMTRGGNFWGVPLECESGYRVDQPATSTEGGIGVRAARRLDPPRD